MFSTAERCYRPSISAENFRSEGTPKRRLPLSVVADNLQETTEIDDPLGRNGSVQLTQQAEANRDDNLEAPPSTACRVNGIGPNNSSYISSQILGSARDLACECFTDPPVVRARETNSVVLLN